MRHRPIRRPGKANGSGLHDSACVWVRFRDLAVVWLLCRSGARGSSGRGGGRGLESGALLPRVGGAFVIADQSFTPTVGIGVSMKNCVVFMMVLRFANVMGVRAHSRAVLSSHKKPARPFHGGRPVRVTHGTPFLSIQPSSLSLLLVQVSARSFRLGDPRLRAPPATSLDPAADLSPAPILGPVAAGAPTPHSARGRCGIRTRFRCPVMADQLLILGF